LCSSKEFNVFGFLIEGGKGAHDLIQWFLDFGVYVGVLFLIKLMVLLVQHLPYKIQVYLVSSETTNARVWCTCNVVPTTPWAFQISQESYIEHQASEEEEEEKKKKGYNENSTSYHIAIKHKHDTNKLVETF
jgi:hypothetical protein